MSIINSSERAALEMKLRSVLGAGVATTVLLRLLDHVNTHAVSPVEYVAVPDEGLAPPVDADDTSPEPVDETAENVHVTVEEPA